MTTGSEADRDQVESSFTGILRRFFNIASCIEAVAFVDDEGECIDYCSSIDPFEVKVTGAHLLMVAKELRRRADRFAAGQISSVQIFADERDYVLRLLSNNYALIAAVLPGCVEPTVTEALERCVAELRTEAGIPLPSWDPSTELNVQLRLSPVWEVAPYSFDHGEKTTMVMDVIGRWEEPRDALGNRVVCFRVRTTENVEVTLMHDLDLDRWLLADEYRNG